MKEVLSVKPDIAKIEVFPTREATALAGAEIICQVVANNPTAAITYATGDTMIPVYEAIKNKIEGGTADFSKTIAFHLDEYYPCSPDEPHSFQRYLQRYVFRLFQIPPEKCFTINGLAQDPQTEAARYNQLLAQQQIDLAILGIGPGSHIAFNEQGTPFDSQTHLATLSQETIRRDQQERGQNTPIYAITQGIANILAAEKILLIAYGSNKGEYLKPALFEPVSVQYPASALRRVGEKVNILIDQQAANTLQGKFF